jgi:hypothetical protein
MHDYPLEGLQRMVRGGLYRSGLLRRLGDSVWSFRAEADFIKRTHYLEASVFDGMPCDFSDASYSGVMRSASDHWSRQEEYVVEAHGCWVEPNRCMVISEGRIVVEQSRGHPHQPLYPDLLAYAGRSKAWDFGKAVVYDGFASKSYYHHLVDRAIAFKLILEDGVIDSSVPLLVSEWIFSSPFFRYMLERSNRIASLNWCVLPPGRWVRARSSQIVRAMPFDPSAWRYLRHLYGRISGPKGRRIFLSRDKSRFTRGLANEDAVASMLKHYGFEKIYAEHLTLPEQQALFEETEFLVALEGMGLVQQFFMDPSRSRVVEIVPSDRMQTEYYWQAWALGMNYFDVVVGSSLDARSTYRVDLERLHAAILSMLEHSGNCRRLGVTDTPLTEAMS